MGEHRLTFPWPPRALSPNARVHWAEKARAAKKYRAVCRLMAQAMGCRALNAERLTVEITFHPPNRHRRDTDNLLASVKAGLDGLADATGVDDSHWNYGIAKGEPVTGGAVVVRVTEADAWQGLGDVAGRMVKGGFK